MISPQYTFYLLCLGELCVVFTGFASIPVATCLQILILLAIFPNLVFSKYAFHPVAFLVSFSIATIFFASLVLSFRHTFLIFLLVAVTSAFAILCLICSENRLEQQSGGFA